MLNPLNIILPFLFAKPKPAASLPEKHPIEEAEEFSCILRNVAGMTDSNDLGQRILDLAVQMSYSTTLNQAEAVGYIKSWIMDRLNKGMPAEKAVDDTFRFVNATYLTRPLGVFDKRPDVNVEEGGFQLFRNRK